MEESENESSSSEVGLPPPPANDANLLSILEMQNRSFAELIKQVQCSQNEPKDAKTLYCQSSTLIVQDATLCPGVQRSTTSCLKTSKWAALL